MPGCAELLNKTREGQNAGPTANSGGVRSRCLGQRASSPTAPLTHRTLWGAEPVLPDRTKRATFNIATQNMKEWTNKQPENLDHARQRAKAMAGLEAQRR